MIFPFNVFLPSPSRPDHHAIRWGSAMAVLFFLFLLPGGGKAAEEGRKVPDPGMVATRAESSEEKPSAPASSTLPKSYVILEMENGETVTGELLKKDAENLYLYVAGNVVILPQAKVKKLRCSEKEEESVEKIRTFSLYATGVRPIRSVRAMAEEFGPAIVVVKTPAGLGTGWFVNTKGYVITNHHVIAGERSISITAFPKEEGKDIGKKVFKKVRIVALNDDLDLALLKIEEPIDFEYPQLYLGDSDAIKVGDPCFLIGNPLGLERSVSEGTVSKAARNYAGRLYIQTTAPIAPGNSGGPFFNERGEVVGVVNMGAVFFDGIGFAIPIKYVKEFLDNVESFAYDEDNPNIGVQYMEPPITSIDKRIAFTSAEFLKIGFGASCLQLADLDRDGVKEILFVNNNKAEISMLRRRRPEEKETRTIEDVEDINRLPESDRFILKTLPIASKVTSLAVADISGDGRPDLVFLGDVDGLAVMTQKEDGTFTSPRKIDYLQPAERRNALRIADLDGDGSLDLFVLGKESCSIFWKGSRRTDVPLNSAYASQIKDFFLVDLNADNRLDIVFFATDKRWASYRRLQNAQGEFIEEIPVRESISGPVVRLSEQGEGSFFTLDKGMNRVRRLVYLPRLEKPAASEIPASILTLPIHPRSGVTAEVEIGDLNEDGYLDLLTLDTQKNEFVVYLQEKTGFRPIRSPSPQGVGIFKLHRTPRGPVCFCLSTKDRIFGISPIVQGKVAFPRPLVTENPADHLVLSTFSDGTGKHRRIFWVEKIEKSENVYVLRSLDVDAVAERVLSGGEGSIMIEPETLRFRGQDTSEVKGQTGLAKKPEDFAFADFNGDGTSDLLVYWSFTGKETLYLQEDGVFVPVVRDQKIFDNPKEQPLLVEDIDGDGNAEILLVQPGFVRILRVDMNRKLFAERQFNWEFDTVKRLAPYSTEGGKPRFLALGEALARVVELDVTEAKFTEVARLDLAGLKLSRILVVDMDCDTRPDILGVGEGALYLFRNREDGGAFDSRVVFQTKLDDYTYWNLDLADLDGDEREEALLFDSRRAMFEVHRIRPEGDFTLLLRHRLFEKAITQRNQSDSIELPKELAVGDVDGDGTLDLICILQDRVAIYLQDRRTVVSDEKSRNIHERRGE